ncbi:MAG: flavodoxin family protein [Bacillota bacterium]|nr:flavodoxin family protein [Bacillota bacterium]
MLIIGLNGSPNKDANTAAMLKKALSETEALGAETILFNVAEVLKDAKHPFCNACSAPCNKSCFAGTKVEELFSHMRKADGIIIGSPVYFGTISAQLKGLWDKGRDMRKDKALVNVIGGAMATGSSRFGGQETTIASIHDMMLVQGMIVVGGGHPDHDAGHQGAATQRPALDDEAGITRAGILGKRVAEVAKATSTLRVRK